MSSGFGTEDAYAIYDKPLFAGSSANLLYRAKNNEDSGDIQGIERLLEAPHQGFKGADGNKGTGGPVEFEKEDVFGVDAFMEDAKRGRRGNDDENDDENDRRNVKETQENKRGRRG